MPPPRDSSKRVDNPTDATPATFELNWSYSENGPTDPQPQANAVTFMGPAITEHAGKGKRWPFDRASALKAALDIFRKEGLTCEIPPPDYELDEENVQDEELEYLKEEYHEDFHVKKGNEIKLVMTTKSDWIYLRTTIDQSDVIEKLNDHHFALGRIEHKEETILDEDGWTIVQRTGGRDAEDMKCSPGTMFLLKKGNKIISKALCSYSNGEMDASGPTIELLETAAEWQGHGHGTRLLEAIEEHFEAIFENVLEVGARVKFNVCYVTNFNASQWFQHQGFHDLDGMGEELGKELGDGF